MRPDVLQGRQAAVLLRGLTTSVSALPEETKRCGRSEASANPRLSSACCASAAEADRHPLEVARMSFFGVPLECEAATGLGCGVKAKPVLQALAGQRGVSRAWLNRNGTIVALLWHEVTGSASCGERVRSVLAKHGLEARELTGLAREAAVRDFSAEGWYRVDTVDRLSEEEAVIIAARLVRRVTAKVRLADEKVRTLTAALAEVCRRELVDPPLTSARARRQRIASEIVQAGRALLEDAELKALQEAAALGHRPASGEE